MKKLLSAICAISLFASCTKNTDTDIDVTGVWVFDKVNNKEVLTNEIYGCVFTEDGTHEYLQWAALNDGESTIIYKDASTYTTSGKTLTIKSPVDNIVLEVTCESNFMNWLEIEKIVGGEDYYMGYTYQGYRCENDYREQIVEGKWEGRATEGRTTNPYILLTFHSDSTYDFQYRQTLDEPWSPKADNDGHYHLIGNLLGNLWTNDINSGSIGQTAESWIISFEGDTMNWEATREGNHIERFEFKRVE